MPHRILVVDDEESIRSTVTDYLEGQGFDVRAAADGDEAIRLLSTFAPHLALIDFLLPRKNGFAVAEAIRKHATLNSTPIIMMSGVFKNPRTAVEAREKYGVIEFLSKPLDLDLLLLLVRESLAEIEPSDARGELDLGIEPSVPGIKAGSNPGYAGSHPGKHGERGIRAENAPDQRPGSPGGSYGRHHGEVDSTEDLPSDGDVVGGIYHGRPFAPLSPEGTIENYPPALILSVLRYDAATGMLDLSDQGTHRRIYVVEGSPSFMQSNAEGENVGALLLRRGRITEPDFERCLRFMKDRNRTLQQSLLELRLVSEQDLATAYKLLAGQLLPMALAMTTGNYRWRETDAFIGRVPEGQFDGVAVIFEGIRRHVHPPQILRFFRGREDVPLLKTTEFDKLLSFFRRAFTTANIAHRIDGTESYRTILRSHVSDTAAVVPQLYALVTSGMAVLAEHEDEHRLQAVVSRSVFAEASGGDGDGSSLELEDDQDNLSPEENKARATIGRYYDRIFAQNFFEVLGVSPKSDEEAVRAGYFELVKTWSRDAFAGLRLGPQQRRMLDEIFERITEVYETIADRNRREDYLAYLERKAKGLPTDVEEILKAERLFEQAQAMVRRRDWEGANPILEEAIQLNPGEPIYYAILGWVTFSRDPKSQECVTQAVQYLRKAISEQENLAIAYQYLGEIANARGQPGEAVKWWQRCLEWEPGNVEAARGLRLLSQRTEREGPGNKGLLGRLMTTKKQ